MGHPWVRADQFADLPDALVDGESVALVDAAGEFLGCGILDRRDAAAVWRRYSMAENVAFDEAYLATALVDSIDRRSGESCQCLVNSDADFIPGLVVELYGDVVWVSCQTAAVQKYVGLIAEVIMESLHPVEIVLEAGDGPKTLSGQGLKGRWVKVDDLLYRIDFLNTKKPRFFIDQREQHVLVGSLCESRRFLDAFSHSGAFAMQAACAGASSVLALEIDEIFSKAIQANAQRNESPVETVCADAFAYLAGCGPGDFDAIVLDPPESVSFHRDDLVTLNRLAFTRLAQGGVLASYCRSVDLSPDAFERIVAEAAAQAGREARVFARTSQPFDFPILLNFPESMRLKGLILEVL